LIANVTANNNNTIVVIHSVGPILMPWANNANISAILWAGLPGQQSGNAIANILYGKENPGAKLPFTIGSSRQEYGTDIMYESNNGLNAPQLEFTEGVFIDYRAFDKNGVTPTFEFGFGMSYTTFEYSNIQVVKHNVGAYTPTSGMTPAAPAFSNSSTNINDYQFPSNFTVVEDYIYPYVNGTDARTASGDRDYGLPTSDYTPAGATDGSPQPRIPAGGGLGGNPQLYDVMFTVTATITNTGPVAGDEVGQVYISLGGPNDPKVALRGFERLSIQPGQSTTFGVDLTRRDLSNWDTNAQNWFISAYPKTVYVGSSSRKLPLSTTLSI